MSQTLSTAFSAIPDDKIISMKEMKKLTDGLYKELSLADQIYLNVIDRPLSVIGGAVIGVKLVADQKLRDAFSRINADGSLGYFKDTAGATYVSVASLRQSYIEAMRSMPVNQGFQERLTAKAEQAVQQCKDYKTEAQNGALKPLKFD